MDHKVILSLMKEMNNTDLTKLEIEENGVKICIEKAAPTVNVTQPTIAQPSYSPNYIPAQPAANQMFAQQQTITTVATTNNENSENQIEEIASKKLVSPMVGTFYAASSPDKPAFVKVGDKVKKGQPICIIEAMKLMNEIESEHDGEIVKVLVKNEDMVEFGQPLFLIK